MRVTREEIIYKSAPYYHVIAKIPAGTEDANSWARNYGFLVSEDETILIEM